VGAHAHRGAIGLTGRTDRELLALLVHEVRSPVAALAAIAAELESERLPERDLPDLLELTVAACRAIDRVVGDAALGSVHLEPADVGRLARDAAAAATLGGARVRAMVASDVPGLQADPLRLRQALDNLIANAVTIAPPERDVVVTVGTENAQIFVSVIDEGPGIPRSQQERIFEPGVRLDPGRSGSGLGLAVARSIVEAHAGTLTVESEPGKGASFTIALPLARP
jgi:signal transduction histidine kinase